jgi:hypothetical protein
MSTGAQTEAAGPSGAGVAEGAGQAAVRSDAAGRLLGRLSVLPALLVVAWLLVGLPLLLAGAFTAVLMVVLSVPAAIVLVAAGWRWVPGRRLAADPATGRERECTPWWTVVAVIAVAVVFGLDQFVYHSNFIIVTRDPASYIQFANWIAHHGSLPIPQDRGAFGGTSHLLSFQSFAYYQVGGTIVPQFMAGLPMILAAGFWTGGAASAVAMAPIFGACAVLAFGGLAARLAGPRWAPLAALVLAISLPEQFTSRSTYSEPVAQILLFGGLCLLIDSLDGNGIGARIAAGLGGLALGLTVLVRIDGAGDILPVIPYCGLLLLGRRRQALPFLGGLVIGGIYGGVDGLVLSRPYLSSIKSALVPLVLLTGAAVVVTALAMVLLWRRGVPRVRGNWLPNAAAALACLVVLGFAVRPYVQTVRAKGTRFFESIIVDYQRADHVPVAPERLYYELSLHWVFWYVGVPAVILGTAGAALLSRRCLRGRAPAWTLPLMIFAWAIITTLYSPSITPDHPWASRRLVPAVLPGFILFAVWASRWLMGWLRRISTDRVLYAGIGCAVVAVLVVPATITTFGLRVKDGGPVGVRLAAEGLAFKRTYEGEIAAVSHMCAAIPRDASVVFIDSSNGGASDRLAQVVRGTCGVPVGSIGSARPATVDQVTRGIERAGRRPVLLAGVRARLKPYGGQIRHIMRLRSTQDENALTAPPLHTLPFNVDVWMSEPAP